MLPNHQSNVFVCVLSVKKCLVGLIFLVRIPHVRDSLVNFIHTACRSLWSHIYTVNSKMHFLDKVNLEIVDLLRRYFISYLDKVDWSKKTLTWWSMSLELIYQQIRWRGKMENMPTNYLARSGHLIEVCLKSCQSLIIPKLYFTVWHLIMVYKKRLLSKENLQWIHGIKISPYQSNIQGVLMNFLNKCLEITFILNPIISHKNA